MDEDFIAGIQRVPNNYNFRRIQEYPEEILMIFKKISDREDVISFDFTCPFCSKKYTIEKSWTKEENGSRCIYEFPEHEIHCEHLFLWESSELGAEYPDEIHDLEWITRMSGLPFRVRDVLQEIINNDDLSEGCEVRIRAFYVSDYIVFIFGNDAKAQADAVLEKCKGYIQNYNAAV